MAGNLETSKSYARKLWLARGACFLQIGCGAQLSIYAAVHMTDKGLSGTAIGILLAIESALIILTGPLWGWVADRYHFYRRLIAIGTIGLTATMAWFAIADSELDFLFYVLLRGIMVTSVMGVMPALALANLPPESQGKSFGSYRSFGSIGFMTSSLLLPMFLPSIESIILLAALVFPTSLYFVFALERPPPRTTSEEEAFHKKLPPLLYWFLVANFLVCLTDPAINGFYNSYARTLGADLEWIGFISSLNGFTAFLFLPIMGSWVDRRGPKLILLLGYASQSLRMLSASFVTAPEWLWMPQVFHIFGWAGREVAAILFIAVLAGTTKRATAMGLYVSTKMAGLMVGSFLMGRLSDLYGYSVMFQIVSAIAAFSLVFLLYVFSRDKRAQG